MTLIPLTIAAALSLSVYLSLLSFGAPPRQLALHIWHDMAFATLKKRIARSVVGIYDTARRESAECFDDGEYVAQTVEVRSCAFHDSHGRWGESRTEQRRRWNLTSEPCVLVAVAVAVASLSPFSKRLLDGIS